MEYLLHTLFSFSPYWRFVWQPAWTKMFKKNYWTFCKVVYFHHSWPLIC